MLSSFLTGRSANRGACSQPCRWTYTLHERTRPEEAMPIEEDERGTAILSSRDICMMEHLPRLMESGVCCFKIEGRMKTEIYIATVVGAYRRAMNAYAKSPAGYRADAALQRRLRGELDKISHRVYDTGFYFGQPKVCGEAVGVTQEAEYMGYVLAAMLVVSGAFVVFVEAYGFSADMDAENLASGIGNAWKMLGAVAGMTLAWLLDRRYIHFETQAVWWVQVIKVAVGMALLLAIKSGLKAPLLALLGHEGLAGGVRYFLLVLVAGAVWPLVFRPMSKWGKGKK